MLHAHLLIWGFLVWLVSLGQVQAQEVTDVVKRAFKVWPGGRLNVEMDRGSLEVVTTSESMVYVEVIRIVDVARTEEAQRLLQHHRLDLRQEDNQVVISSALTDDRGGPFWRRRRSPVQVRIRVRVPQRFAVSFSSDAGNIEIRDVGGTVMGQTGAGNISLHNLRGTVEIKTGAGNLEAHNLEGYLRAETGAGNITAKGLMGGAELNTGAGNITVEWAAAPTKDSRCRSGAGNVTIYVGSNAAFTLRASTGIGSISTDFAVHVDRSWISASAHGEVNGGGPTLQVETGLGNIAVRRV